MKIPYNGHESWNAWNVSLWIGNDEGLYRLAIHCLEVARRKHANAARAIHFAGSLFCAEVGTARTPDGARYSLRSVRLALEGLE